FVVSEFPALRSVAIRGTQPFATVSGQRLRASVQFGQRERIHAPGSTPNRKPNRGRFDWLASTTDSCLDGRNRRFGAIRDVTRSGGITSIRVRSNRQLKSRDAR